MSVFRRGAEKTKNAAAALAIAVGLTFSPMTDSLAQNKSKTETAMKKAEVNSYKLSMLQTLVKKSATNEQRGTFVKIFDSMVKKYKEDAEVPLKNLKEVIENPNFNPKMISTLSVIVEKSGDEDWLALSCFNRILENPNFNPEMLDTIDLIVERSNVPYDSEGDVSELSIIYSLQEFEDLLDAPNFDPFMRDAVHTLVEKSEEDFAYVLNSLCSILENKKFKPGMIHTINILAGMSKSHDMSYVLGAFADLLENEKFDPKMQDTVDSIIKKEEVNADNVLYALNSLMSNPNFEPGLLEGDFDERLAKLINSITKKNKDGYDYRVSFALRRILSNGNFKPQALGHLELLVEKSGANVAGAMQIFAVILERPDFKPEMLDEKLVVAVSNTANTLEPALYSAKSECIPSPTTICWAGDEHGTMNAFAELVGKPDFKLKMLEKSGKDFAGVVGLMAEKSGSDINYVVGDLLSFSRHPGSKPEMLETLNNIIKKSNTSPYYFFEVFNRFVYNPKLRDSISTDEFAENFSYTIDYIIEKNSGHEAEIISAFQRLAGNKHFKAKMLEKKFAPVLNLILQRMTEGGDKEWKPDKVLKDFDYQPAISNKKHENTVKLITEKTGDNAGTAIWVLNQLSKHGYFKPKLLKIVDVIVDKTSPNAPDSGIGDDLEDDNCKDTACTIWALDGLLDNPNFNYGLSGELKAVIEGSGADAKAGIKAFDELLDNPSFKPKILNDLTKAENFVKENKWDEYAKENGLSQFEIVMNAAYALDVLGEDKIRTLHSERGILYFGRYSKKLLNYLADDSKSDKEKPLFVAILNKSDWNKAFYWDGLMLNRMLKYYNVEVFEVDSDEKFYDTLDKHSGIEAHFIAGHGNRVDIRLGGSDDDVLNEKNEKNHLDMTDIDAKNEKGLEKLKSRFVENPTVFLASCSTGFDENAIGAVLSKIWGATLWAPNQVSGISGVILDSEGKIKSVKYRHNAGNKFVNGKLQPKKK